jgi:hypothetical protein
MTSWRFRSCPSCGTVRGASTFQLVGNYRRGWNERGTLRRRCPDCGHAAPTSAFKVVRQHRGRGAA